MTANLKTLIPVLGLAFISTLSQATSHSPSQSTPQSTPQSTSSDFLVHETVAIASTSSSAVLDRTAANLDQVFARYKPNFDSSTTILSPLAVTGTALHPILKLSAQKCVAFICETVDMDGVVSL